MESFVHIFKTVLGYYLYDVNRDKILGIPEEVYCYFDKGIKTNGVEEYLSEMKEQGYLSEKRVLRSEHPASDFLEYYYKSKINYLVIQLTQNCNLRCDYCVYSGDYKTRGHNKKRISFEIAKKGMDYLISHSRESKRLMVGFYGGEPLLEFRLIKKCVDYMKAKAEGKEISYSLTTNGTLLSEEIVEFFNENNVRMVISLDGPKDIHDKSRKYLGSNEGSYETIIRNLKRIKEEYPDYYRESITFNTVVDPEKDYDEVTEYINHEPLMKNNMVQFSAISGEYTNKKRTISEKNRNVLNYDRFLGLLYKAGRLNEIETPVLMRNAWDMEILETYLERDYRDELPDVFHRGGPCIPGVKKIFMTVEGFFYPCEKVCETLSQVCIGNVESGIDVEKAKKLLNIEHYTEEKCRNCWAYNHCNICCASMEEGEMSTVISKKCSDRKRVLEEKFKDYCILKSIGERI